MKSTIRLAGLADARRYCEHIIRFAQDNGRDGIYFSPYSASHVREIHELEKRVRERWDKQMTEPGCERSLIALIESADAAPIIVGHLDLLRDPLTPSAHRLDLSMGIEYDHKKKGLGSALMKEAIGFARFFEGAAWIDLGVFRGNWPALALYRKFGFVETGVVPDKFRADGLSIDDIQMTYRLSSSGAK